MEYISWLLLSLGCVRRSWLLLTWLDLVKYGEEYENGVRVFSGILVPVMKYYLYKTVFLKDAQSWCATFTNTYLILTKSKCTPALKSIIFRKRVSEQKKKKWFSHSRNSFERSLNDFLG